MNEIKQINPLPFLSTLEANPERDEWIKQREKELAEQAEKEAAYQMQKSGSQSAKTFHKRKGLYRWNPICNISNNFWNQLKRFVSSDNG